MERTIGKRSDQDISTVTVIFVTEIADGAKIFPAAFLLLCAVLAV